MDLKPKFRKNWSKLKDELSARARAITDSSLEAGILDYDDVEKINSFSMDVDKVETILMKVIKLGKCEQFMDILQDRGFGRLCSEVRETVIEEESNDNRNSINEDNETSLSCNLDQILNRGIQDLKNRDETLNQRLKQRYERFDSHLKGLDEKLDHHIARIDEKLTTTINQCVAARMKSFVEKEKDKLADKYENENNEKYDKLQEAYKNARAKIGDLTKLAQEKQSKIIELTRETEKLKDQIDEVRNMKPRRSDPDADIIQTHTEKLDKMDTDYNQKIKENEDLTREVEQCKNEKENLELKLQEMESDLKILAVNYDKMRKEKRKGKKENRK